jgi:Mrp family chromosome partitioning ATPase
VPPANANPAIGNETVMLAGPVASGAHPAIGSGSHPSLSPQQPQYPMARPAAGRAPTMQPLPSWRPPQGSGPSFAPVAILQPPQVRLPPGLDRRLILLNDPDSERAASFRLLRDNLLAKRLPRVLAVTSSVKKDGKTTCAVNLALSLSEGARILLLEGNFVEPALAGIFNMDESVPSLPNAPWLAPYRVAELSPSLHIAAAPREQAAPRFDKTWFEQLIGFFRRSNYNFIIIDAAAMASTPSVAHLLATADATLLAVRAGITTARALRRASEQIPQGKAIGVALIDAKQTP